ncbi:MAG TPA: hypothetical protein PKD74_01285 [Candidatus Dependentiae bacterium]|nr:hypothetical protein [Candidatus Dependentiae bacterium]
MNEKLLTLSIVCIYCITAAISYRNTLRNARSLPTIEPSLPTVDLIIFSFDRPMQLYALCESIEHHMQGLENTTVIYRASDEAFEQAYNQVKQRFASTDFIRQGSQPSKDFKPLLISSLRSGRAPYVCFAVDDMVVKQDIDLIEVTQMLEQTHAYGFFLRLGTHISSCYMLNQKQPIPLYTQVSDNILAWSFKDGIHDWNYAHTVDMTVYRKKDLILDFITMDYTNPNTLEASWARNMRLTKYTTGLCYSTSAVVNIPMNLVQEVYSNRSMHSWTAEQLLEKFNEGLKFDIKPLDGILNESCHIAYTLPFVQREPSLQHS